MKRIIALLTALLCLAAVPALGESRYATITFAASEAELTEGLAADGVPDAGTLATGVAKLLNSLTLECCVANDEAGEQLMKATLLIGEESLLDMTACIPADKSCLMLASSLIPGYAVRFPVGEGELENASLNATHVDVAALEQLVSGPAAEKARQWMDGLNSVTSFGDFMGDAYDSGRACVDLTLEDSDLYVLCMHLEPEIGRAFEMLGIPGEEKSLLQGMLEAAVANANQYRVRLVYDGAGALTGVSVTALNNGTQVATLSLGFENPGATRFVLGLGLQDEVYYLDGDFRTVENTAVTARLYADPMKAGFPAAREEEKNLLQTLTLEISSSRTEDAWTVEYSGTLQTPGSPAIREKGAFHGSKDLNTFEDSTFQGDREQPVLTVRYRDETSDSLPAWPEDLQVLDDPADERLLEAMHETSGAFSAAIIRLIPAELLVYIVRHTDFLNI